MNTYSEALAALHSLQRLGVQPGLARIRELLRRLGNPQQRPVCYVQVAGTNGKGSVSALLQAMLQAAGKQNGLFTSPHLHSHLERYRLNGQAMAEADFVSLFQQVWQHISEMCQAGWDCPTEFEAATALALLYFARQQTTHVVLEVGMGGRYDSTNVIDADYALITNVGMDHMQYLGDSIAQIAVEKAGIIKAGSSVITAASGEALAVVAAKAAQEGAPLLCYGRDFSLQDQQLLPAQSSFTFVSPSHRYADLQLSLLGAHQLENAALAVAAATQLGLPEQAIRRGLATASWPGRLEQLCAEPLVVIDGAHNVPGMQTLAAAVAHYWPGRKICALLGMLADKQREQALAPLLPLLAEVVVIPPPVPTRSGDWRQIAGLCRAAGLPTTECEDGRAAVALALERLRTAQVDMVLAAGSLYLIADLRRYFLEELA